VSIEKRYIHRDGSVIWANTYLSVVRDKAARALYCVIAIEDVTDRRRLEEEKWLFYRETISSVTKGKLQIVTPAESRVYEEKRAVNIRVNTAEEVAPARQTIRDYCEFCGLVGDQLEMLVVGLGEAIANALKHAEGGDVFAGCEDGRVWVGVADKGPGIAAFSLPSATLSCGSSSKLSMGFGYSIMMNVSDQIMLSTGSEGTTVVLVKQITSTTRKLRLEDLRDTWDSI
jgi:anti-sigma regulatory factor (Ser/Thr protein kinase)